MLFRVLSSKTKTISGSALLLAVSALVSRLLGLFRDNLLANLFTKTQTDIYFSAFRIPDFLYGILITGGIVAAFMPVFSKSYSQNAEEARKLTGATLSFFLLLLAGISLVLFIFTPLLMDLVVPGFSPEQKAVTTELVRIMFLSPILLGASAIISGVLQYFNFFLSYSLAPIFYNVGLIAGILFLSRFMGLKGLAWGVILGAFLHFLIQIPPLIKTKFIPKISFNFRLPGIKKIFYLMLPRVIGSAAYHINFIVVTAIASGLSAGAISVFNFSNNLQSVPIGLVGISFATASFPVLSRDNTDKKPAAFARSFNSALSKILFLIIPLSILFFVLRAQIVRLVLGVSILGEGQFGWEQTRLIAASLGIFSLSLFASALIPFLARAFFSVSDTKTPVKIAVFVFMLNIVLSLLFVYILGTCPVIEEAAASVFRLQGVRDIRIVGVALAFFISAIFHFFLLMRGVKKKIISVNLSKTKKETIKIIVASAVAGLVCYGFLHLYQSLWDKTYKVWGLLFQTILSGGAATISFLLLSYFLKIKECLKIKRKIWR